MVANRLKPIDFLEDWDGFGLSIANHYRLLHRLAKILDYSTLIG
jgi:hypothetical protein